MRVCCLSGSFCHAWTLERGGLHVATCLPQCPGCQAGALEVIPHCLWMWQRARSRKAFLEISPGCAMPGKVPAIPVAPAEVSPWALAICHGLEPVRVCEHPLPPEEGGSVDSRLEEPQRWEPSRCCGTKGCQGAFSSGTGTVTELQCSSLCPGAA